MPKAKMSDAAVSLAPCSTSGACRGGACRKTPQSITRDLALAVRLPNWLHMRTSTCPQCQLHICMGPPPSCLLACQMGFLMPSAVPALLAAGISTFERLKSAGVRVHS